MKSACFLVFFSLVFSISAGADVFSSAPPTQQTAALMKARNVLLQELGKARSVVEAKPPRCEAIPQVFAVLRKSEPPATCPKAKDQLARLTQVEKELSRECQGPKARAIWTKFTADNDWYQKMLELDSQGKNGGEMSRLECELPLTLLFQARKGLGKIAN